MADEEMPCGLVLLAAGASTRMGRPKQLIEIDGVALVRRTAMAALASPAKPVVVVLGANAPSIRPQLADLAITVSENADWADGMGGSLRGGVQALIAAAPHLGALIVALADQPHFTAELVGRLLARQRTSGKSIVASSHGDHLGPPVLFLRRHFAELLALSGDAGARSILQAHAGDVVKLSVPGEADLDTPADVARFLAEQAARQK